MAAAVPFFVRPRLRRVGAGAAFLGAPGLPGSVVGGTLTGIPYPADPSEPVYCYCQRVSYGDMVRKVFDFRFEGSFCSFSSDYSLFYSSSHLETTLTKTKTKTLRPMKKKKKHRSRATTRTAQSSGSTTSAWASRSRLKGSGTAGSAPLREGREWKKRRWWWREKENEEKDDDEREREAKT